MPRRRLLLSLAPALAVTACSVFPSPHKPPSVVESMHVEYTFAPDAPRAIQVPASSDDLTVLELAVEPAPRGERFERGHRILLLPSDCHHAHLRCRVQRWSPSQPGELLAPPHGDLFPGALHVRVVDEPNP